jgi:hypothetical protein
METRYFAVDIEPNGVLPEASEAPVVFHGVNKSGSLVMSNVIRDAYRHARRANQFFSTYHRSPLELEDLALILNNSTGHNFFVSHYIYKGIELPDGTVLVGQFRHPLSRTLSIYGWVKRNHIRRCGSEEGLPDLETFIKSLKGIRHTQMAQIANGFPQNRVERARLSSADLLEIAKENVERDFAWFGLADFFEESIFCLAHICGLKMVPAWQKDERNTWRQPLRETENHIVELIENTLCDEISFYNHVVGLFEARIARIAFSDSLAAYKQHCASEYVERITKPRLER